MHLLKFSGHLLKFSGHLLKFSLFSQRGVDLKLIVTRETIFKFTFNPDKPWLHLLKFSYSHPVFFYCFRTLIAKYFFPAAANLDEINFTFVKSTTKIRLFNKRLTLRQNYLAITGDQQ